MKNESLSKAVRDLGGPVAFARRFGLNYNTVGVWVHRGEVPPRVLLDNKPVANALKRAGYKR